MRLPLDASRRQLPCFDLNPLLATRTAEDGAVNPQGSEDGVERMLRGITLSIVRCVAIRYSEALNSV